mmetsp:Transcript_3199/g.3108  ORF Transcript_3199/g.3108 Transcript_3199/m.3108 type:complete len:80 (+) Transcript_3199:175-414(+)
MELNEEALSQFEGLQAKREKSYKEEIKKNPVFPYYSPQITSNLNFPKKPNPTKPFIIGITGGPSSGKSMIAQSIKKHLE